MKRRDFLHLAIATTAAGAGPLFARQQQTGPVGANDRIRAAIIGCGNRGRAVAREWIEHGDTTFVAACDVDKTRTDAIVAEFAQAGHKADGYEDYAVTWQFENFVATLSNAMIPGGEQPEENYGNWFHGNRGVMLVNRFGYDIRPVASGGGRGGGRGRGDGGRGGRGDADAAAAAAPPPPPPIEAKRVWDPNGRSEAQRHGVRLRHQPSHPQLSRQRQVAAEACLRHGSRICGLAPMPARQRGDSTGAHREVEREQGDLDLGARGSACRAAARWAKAGGCNL